MTELTKLTELRERLLFRKADTQFLIPQSKIPTNYPLLPPFR